ncbi:MAG: dynamin family protein [Verrucomicrobia bacterium]|nr:dynamin family protein [Verrucomicrobiota bacterium]
MLDATYLAHRERLADTLDKVAGLARTLGLGERAATLDEVRRALRDPFLFVVVGEVKAGKSSFINALLGAKVCDVAPDPCTDRVTQIVYADEPFTKEIGPLLRQTGVKADILRSIAIVDTPGTGAIIREHQQITENFIPRADLALFVFSAVNPHTGAAWDMLDFVRAEWRKKVVFVLQQSDRATLAELEVNRRAVEQYAAQRGLKQPLIFATSALREGSGDKGSGFAEVREFIAQSVTGGANAKLKLENAAVAGEKILTDAGAALTEEAKRQAGDAEVAQRMEDRLGNAESRSAREIDALVERLELNYNRLAAELTDEFERGLSLSELFSRTIGPIFGGKKPLKAWIEDLKSDFEKRLSPRVEELAQEGAQHYLDGVRLVLNDLITDLSRVRPADGAQAPQLFMKLPGWHGETAGSVTARLKALLEDDKFTASLQGSGTSAIPVALGGSVAAVLGVIAGAVTHVLVMDITGGIVTALAAAGAGFFVLFKRGAMLRDFRAALEQGRERFVREVRDRLSSKLGLIYEEIRRVCLPFFDEVRLAKEKLDPLRGQQSALAEEVRVRRSEW